MVRQLSLKRGKPSDNEKPIGGSRSGPEGGRFPSRTLLVGLVIAGLVFSIFFRTRCLTCYSGSFLRTDSVGCKITTINNDTKNGTFISTSIVDAKNETKITTRLPTTSSLASTVLVQHDTSFDYKTLIQGQFVNVCILQASGLTSNLMNIIGQKIFYNDMNRGFIADESFYGYRWDKDQGVLQGFFTPRFPILQPGDWTQIQRDFGVKADMKTLLDNGFNVFNSVHPHIEVQWCISEKYRHAFGRNYKVNDVGLYNRFAAEACTHLQFNYQARQEIQQLINLNNIPDLLKSHSVAFHVRRGDKIKGESASYPGKLYVDKLLSIPGATSKPIEHCFVATDDYDAVKEIRQALNDRNVTCTLHTLRETDEHGGTDFNWLARDERWRTVQFLTEFSLLVDATYFVGTFDSNVGALASVLRKCYYIGSPHYAHSYGVDRDDWYYRL